MAEFKIALDMTPERECEYTELSRRSNEAAIEAAREMDLRRKEAKDFLRTKLEGAYQEDMPDDKLAEHYEPFMKYRFHRAAMMREVVKIQHRATAAYVCGWSGEWPDPDNPDGLVNLDELECTIDNVVNILFTDSEDETIIVSRHMVDGVPCFHEGVWEVEVERMRRSESANPMSDSVFKKKLKALKAEILFPFSTLREFSTTANIPMGMAMYKFIEWESRELRRRSVSTLAAVKKGCKRSKSGEHSAGRTKS
jgi:hypothetical protein